MAGLDRSRLLKISDMGIGLAHTVWLLQEATSQRQLAW
jgi:hypothetical protein|tara:strand:- start:212 stop:325 length:114 start_codon:yes stop_codon:yes gene_type:complete